MLFSGDTAILECFSALISWCNLLSWDSVVLGTCGPRQYEKVEAGKSKGEGKGEGRSPMKGRCCFMDIIKGTNLLPSSPCKS